MENNIFLLQEELATLLYEHGKYEHFIVSDPKQRHISKASVKDRLVHQVMYSVLNPIFDKKFIFHSFSSRFGKGTHSALNYLRKMIYKVSANGTQPCYALKMDILRFFDSVDHNVLKSLIRKEITDKKLLILIDKIIDSFGFEKSNKAIIGIPLGNVTSQLFANIYLHEFSGSRWNLLTLLAVTN